MSLRVARAVLLARHELAPVVALEIAPRGRLGAFRGRDQHRAGEEPDHDRGADPPLARRTRPTVLVDGHEDPGADDHVSAGLSSRRSLVYSIRCSTGRLRGSRLGGDGEDDRQHEGPAEREHDRHDVQREDEFVGRGGGQHLRDVRTSARICRTRPASRRRPRPSSSGPSAPGGSRAAGSRCRGRSRAAPRGAARRAPGRGSALNSFSRSTCSRSDSGSTRSSSGTSMSSSSKAFTPDDDVLARCGSAPGSPRRTRRSRR